METTTGDEVEVACVVEALQACGHGGSLRWFGGERSFAAANDTPASRDEAAKEWGTVGQ